MSAALTFAWRRGAVGLGLAAGLCLAGAAATGAAQLSPPETLATAEARPGEANPIKNPKRLTLFQVSSIGLLASQNTVAYSDLFDFAAADANFKQWTLTAQALKQDDPCLLTPRRRLGHGRISSPQFEQAVCMTSFGLAVYTSPLTINDGRRSTLAFERPGVSTVGRNFDVAVGALSRVPGADEQPHQQIVAAYTNLNQRLEIDVIEWSVDVNDPARGELKVVATYIGPDNEPRPSGDVAVSLGDYLNDSTLQIAIATDVSGGPGPGRMLLAAYTYDPAKKEIKPLGPSYALDVAGGRPTSLDLASGDFAARGHEQVILGYIAPTAGGKSELTLSYFDPTKESGVGPPKASQVMGNVAPNSYADIAPGLFLFNPQDPGAEPADPFFRRQLAAAYATPEGNVFAAAAAMEGDPPKFRVGKPVQMSVAGRPIATDGIGPSLSAGNFIGLKASGIDPFDQIAVALPNPTDPGNPGSLMPEIVVATVKGKDFEIAPVWRNQMGTYSAYGQVFGIPIIAYDRGGSSFYLGNPAHLTVPALVDPQYVVAMPPRHVDALPAPDVEPPYKIENLAGFSPASFNVTLQDSLEHTLTQTSTDSSSSQFGGGTTQTVGSTVSVGFMNIATFETSTQVKAAVSYETNTIESRANKSYKSLTTERSATTSEDDHLIFNMRLLDVWRFPVYGLDRQRDKLYPFYDFVIPGPLTQYSGGGLNFDWYNPPQQNYNAISYPAIKQDALFPTDIGVFTFTRDGEKYTEQIPLNSPTVRSFDGNEQRFALNYTEEAGGSETKSFQYKLSTSLDVSVGFKASANIRLFSSSANYEGTVNLSYNSNWENAVVAERSMRNSRGITLNQPNVQGIIGRAYNYQTLIYMTDNGGFKVAHGTDLLGSTSGAPWWKKNYGGRPDPAVNLPFRMSYDTVQSTWVLTPGEQYFWLRGLTPTEAKPDPLTGVFQPLSGGVNEGTVVRLVLPVHNYSVDTSVDNVVVAFGYQALDPQTNAPANPNKFVEFARSKPVTIGPRGVVSVEVLWNTQGLGGSGAGIPYRFQVVVDPDDEIKNKIHGDDPLSGANTIGTWPWNTGFWVSHSGSRADRVRPGGVRLGLNVTEGLSGPRGTSMADMASVTVDMPASDPALRYLIVSGVSPEGERIALAARSLFGLGPGPQRVEIPLSAHHGLSRLQAWLSAGALPDEPVTGTWVTDEPARPALALGR